MLDIGFVFKASNQRGEKMALIKIIFILLLLFIGMLLASCAFMGLGEITDITNISGGTPSGPPEGVDFDGPIFTGSVLLVSNESSDGNSGSFSGGLTPERVAISEERTEGPRLALEAYRVNPIISLENPDPSKIITPNEESLQGRAVGDKKTFWTVNFQSNQYEQVTATLQAIGLNCMIWVQNITEITISKAQQLAAEFDNKIWSSVTTNFYTPSDKNGDQKIAILCFDIKDDFDSTGSYTGGYFNSTDLYNQASSNLMELFYIDTYPSMHYPSSNPVDVTKAYSTLAHEFQHMVNYNRNVFVENGFEMVGWLDEGLSMAAEHILYGALTSRINYYNTNSSIKNGHSVLYWDEGNVLPNYALSYLFLQYIRVQSGKGNAIFKEIVEDVSNDYKVVEKVVNANINSSLNFGDFMTNFRLALLMKRSTGSYGFKGEEGFKIISTQMYTGIGTNLRGGGAIFKGIAGSFTNPGNAGPNIQYAGVQ